MRILTIYNICGISGFENTAYYVDAINSCLKQKNVEQHVVVSACLSSDLTKKRLKDNFGNKISYNFIEESYPLPVTFNHTVMKCVEHFGDRFFGFFYLDSGINLHDPQPYRPGSYTALSSLAHKFLEHDGCCAIVAAMPSNDDGRSWWGIDYKEEEDYIYPVGKTTNLHCQIYSNEMRKAYDGRLIPDIFANDSSESVTSFLTSAIHKKFLMTQDVNLFHNSSMDGASIGWRGKNQDGTVRLFRTTKSMDDRYMEGYEFGFGYEECKDRWLHDPTCFDEQGFAKSDKLHGFLKKELFLNPQEFNYADIVHAFEPGVCFNG